MNFCGQFRRASWFAFSAALVLRVAASNAGELAVEELRLPPLLIHGQPAKAHTQGMELVGSNFFVTARRDDVRPRTALLLRVDAERKHWGTWDITPLDTQGAVTDLDHPAGMQSDGTRLWIPLAQSKRKGRSLVCAFRLVDLVAGKPLKPTMEFAVSDHIGAVAVSAERGWLLGANWDTEKVYAWNLKGEMQRMLGDEEVRARGLGVAAGPPARAGIAVQDWKFVGNRLFASGLARPPGPGAQTSSSRLCWCEHFLERDFQWWTVTLPRRNGTELAREAMAISGGFAYFLPGDLGTTNCLFRTSLAELQTRGATQPPGSTRLPDSRD